MGQASAFRPLVEVGSGVDIMAGECGIAKLFTSWPGYRKEKKARATVPLSSSKAHPQ
jgi:hypothetical protein